MAMSRFFSQTLTRKPHPSISSIHLRHRSGKSHQAQLIELDLDSSTSQNDAVDAGSFRKLEEVLQSIIARRAAPDWLPFLPGYSYYAPQPPPSSHPSKLIEILGKLSNSAGLTQPGLSHDETMSFRTNQGWPSSTYFIEGTAPTHLQPMGLVVEVKIYDSEEAAQETSSEDE